MRTDGSTKTSQETDTSIKLHEKMKTSRKPIREIQKNLINKENMTSRISNKENIIPTSNKDLDKRESIKLKNFVDKAVQTQSQISEDDLTTEGEPSVEYWKTLAERRRVALDESLEENRRLHEEVDALKEENKASKELLDEAKALVEVLNEIIEEKEEHNTISSN